MTNRIVFWGTDNTDARVMIAMELRTADSKVDLYVIPENTVTNTLDEEMHQKWRNGENIAIPVEAQKRALDLSMTTSLLPDDLKTDRTDLLQRAQTEWHFVVLSAKLYDSYKDELDQISRQIQQLESYSNDAWNTLKDFWDKVMGQVREKNLYRDQADNIKELVNDLFGVLKGKRTEMDDLFKQQSQTIFNEISEMLLDVEKRIVTNARFKSVFDDLKKVQTIFRDSKLTREHGNELWNRIDAAFKKAKEQKFGEAPESTGGERIERRFEGLMHAIGKMQESIDRDRRDLDFEKDKIATTDGQLEVQIRQAKMAMIESRVVSKEDKLREMLETKLELEQKMEQINLREQKRIEREKAEKRIQEEIEQRKKAAAQEKPAAEAPAVETAVAEAPAVETVVAEAPAVEAVVSTSEEVSVSEAASAVKEAKPVKVKEAKKEQASSNGNGQAEVESLPESAANTTADVVDAI